MISTLLGYLYYGAIILLFILLTIGEFTKCDRFERKSAENKHKEEIYKLGKKNAENKYNKEIDRWK